MAERKTNRRTILIAVSGCALLLFLAALCAGAFWFFVIPPPDDHAAPKKDQLKALLDEKADRQRIEKVLGRIYTLYEKDTPNWSAFKSTCSSHPERVDLVAEKYPKFMLYTTTWHRTWIFLDDNDVMQEYLTAGN